MLEAAAMEATAAANPLKGDWETEEGGNEVNPPLLLLLLLLVLLEGVEEVGVVLPDPPAPRWLGSVLFWIPIALRYLWKILIYILVSKSYCEKSFFTFDSVGEEFLWECDTW